MNINYFFEVMEPIKDRLMSQFAIGSGQDPDMENWVFEDTFRETAQAAHSVMLKGIGEEKLRDVEWAMKNWPYKCKEPHTHFFLDILKDDRDKSLKMWHVDSYVDMKMADGRTETRFQGFFYYEYEDGFLMPANPPLVFFKKCRAYQRDALRPENPNWTFWF